MKHHTGEHLFVGSAGCSLCFIRVICVALNPYAAWIKLLKTYGGNEVNYLGPNMKSVQGEAEMEM